MLRTLFAIEITALRSLGVAALIAAGLTTSAQADETNPYTMADNTWITLGGEVESVNPDSFMLDYGDGYILVEMDDGDRDADAYKLLKGDKVTVSGQIDDEGYQKIDVGDRVRVRGEMDSDLFEGRELVADTVIKLNR